MEALAVWSGFAISLGLIFVAAFSRKLVRATPFRASDFYLGIELTLTAISLGAINLIDRAAGAGSAEVRPMVWGTLYIVAGFVIFMIQLAAHQGNPTEGNGTRFTLRRRLLLLIMMNGLGVAIIAAFTVLKSRGVL